MAGPRITEVSLSLAQFIAFAGSSPAFYRISLIAPPFPESWRTVDNSLRFSSVQVTYLMTVIQFCGRLCLTSHFSTAARIAQKLTPPKKYFYFCQNCTSKYQLSTVAAQPQMGKKIDPSISRRVYCPNLIRTLRKKPYQIAKTYMNSQEFAHSNRFICGKPVVTWCKLWCKLSAKSRLYAVILTYTPLISPAASLSGRG